MEIKDLAGLSQPLTKLVEVVSQGIGTLYEPTHIKRMAKARAMEIKTISSAVQESELPIQYNNGQLTIDTSTKEFLERTEKRMLFLEAKKQKNIEDIVSEAYNNLETEKEVSEKPIQEEWINRFFNIIGEISSDNLKTIWSKILSEEIKEPGKCSIRTLENLRNISRDEALIFKKISNYIIKYDDGLYYLPNEDELLKSFNINYGEILKLDEAQLINSSALISAVLNFDENIKEINLIYNNRIIFCNKEEKCEIRLKAYTLTETGRSIFNIMNPTFDEVFFKKYMNIINKKMNVSYSIIVEQLTDGRIKFQVPKIPILKENKE
ncbi:MAG: DUF2806 domain-containing protein [Clostridia bacterium]|nr:DUF2806 domain-containing protein [Clostridia bacterium]